MISNYHTTKEFPKLHPELLPVRNSWQAHANFLLMDFYAGYEKGEGTLSKVRENHLS